MEKIINSKADLNDKITIFILLCIFSLCTLLAFLYHLLVGLIFLSLIFYVYTKLFYKVQLTEKNIIQKYLYYEKITNLNEVSFLQIVQYRGVITFSLSIKLKENKRRINFSHGDKENLLLIIEYFKRNNLKIIDPQKLLFRYYKIDIEKNEG